MTADVPHIVVPYTEFVERRERRARVASELKLQQAQQGSDVEAVAVECSRPLPSDRPGPDENPSGLKRPGQSN